MTHPYRPRQSQAGEYKGADSHDVSIRLSNSASMTVDKLVDNSSETPGAIPRLELAGTICAKKTKYQEHYLIDGYYLQHRDETYENGFRT